jgi:PAS domain S-box-containing protein
MAEGVSVCNNEGIILFTNPAFDMMFGYARGELQGKRVTLLNNYSEEESRKVFENVVKHLRTQRSWSGEFVNRKQDGSLLYTYAQISEIPSTGHWVTVQEDITERKQLELMKVEMISCVSHEMRTPLTALLGFIEFMLENQLEPQQIRQCLLTMERETRRLHELISNFLDLQRMKAQQIVYNFKPIRLEPLLHEAVNLFSGSHQNEINLELPQELPAVHGDETRLHQVLNNLLSNAIKYSPAGSVIVVQAIPHGHFLVVSVKDNGIGIPPDALDRIFEKFYRVDPNCSAHKGIGLGLALVREIVTAHGGKVWAESKNGKGTTFYVALPLDP